MFPHWVSCLRDVYPLICLPKVKSKAKPKSVPKESGALIITLQVRLTFPFLVLVEDLRVYPPELGGPVS